VPAGPPSRDVELRVLGTSSKGQHQSDPRAVLEDIVVAGANQSLLRTTTINYYGIFVYYTSYSILL